jgi:hypothetical protein
MKYLGALLALFSVLGVAPTFAATTAGSMTPPSCPGDQPVWVNTRSKAYHLADDPLYGKTKHGTFMCKAAADAAGDHQAKGHGGAMKGASPAPGAMTSPSAAMSPAPGASPSGHHHHRHHGAGSASPAPSPAAT